MPDTELNSKKTISLPDAMHWVSYSYDSISSESIEKFFRKSKVFKKEEFTISDWTKNGDLDLIRSSFQKIEEAENLDMEAQSNHNVDVVEQAMEELIAEADIEVEFANDDLENLETNLTESEIMLGSKSSAGPKYSYFEISQMIKIVKQFFINENFSMVNELISIETKFEEARYDKGADEKTIKNFFRKLDRS